MKTIFSLFTFLLVIQLTAQTNIYTKKGLAIEGYDVTEYFNLKVIMGNKKHASTYEKATFLFASAENKQKFEANPAKFLPQYGGYCAYAIGLKEEKIKINPETYLIKNGKLYLFYNAWGTNTLDLWNKKGADQLQQQADINWKKMNQKN